MHLLLAKNRASQKGIKRITETGNPWAYWASLTGSSGLRV